MLLGTMIYRWSVTQDLNITEQLSYGIRYLDLRIAFDSNNQRYIICATMIIQTDLECRQLLSG